MSDGFVILPDGTMIRPEEFPLPEGVDDGLLNRVQLARAFSVSENTVSKWIAAGMPVESEGANGVAYEFRLSDCWAWKSGRDAAHRAARDRSDQIAAQAALAFRNLDGDQAEAEGALSAKELRELAEADYHRNRAAELRGELVRSDRVREAFEDIFVATRTSLTTVPDFAEAEFGLSNADVEKLQRRCDAVLVEIRQRIEETLRGRGGEIVGLAGSATGTAEVEDGFGL